MAADGQETERSVVKTYVPEYQKSEWQAHADELGTTDSEYVRLMVQAGRSGFLDDRRSSATGDGNPRGSGLEDRILDVLRSEEYCSWDQLVDHVTDDIEERIEQALLTLQNENLVNHNPRLGGYAIIEDDGGE